MCVCVCVGRCVCVCVRVCAHACARANVDVYLYNHLAVILPLKGFY